MAEVTDADREKAREVVLKWTRSDLDVMKLSEDLAAALAEEREKAQAPFLIRARECELQAEVHDTLGNRETARAFRVCVQRIRRAAEVTE